MFQPVQFKCDSRDLVDDSRWNNLQVLDSGDKARIYVFFLGGGLKDKGTWRSDPNSHLIYSSMLFISSLVSTSPALTPVQQRQRSLQLQLTVAMLCGCADRESGKPRLVSDVSGEQIERRTTQHTGRLQRASAVARYQRRRCRQHLSTRLQSHLLRTQRYTTVSSLILTSLGFGKCWKIFTCSDSFSDSAPNNFPTNHRKSRLR